MMNFDFTNIEPTIFDTKKTFETKALAVLNYQLKTSPLFKNFAVQFDKYASNLNDLTSFPFLPISFFRLNVILAKHLASEKTFESSGTTGTITSRHAVADLKLYQKSILNGFEQFYGSPTNYVILGLLPSYLERENASLVYMTDFLMQLSNHPKNKFYKFNYNELLSDIANLKTDRKILVIGVTFALWDLAEQQNLPNLNNCIFMETGGMKGRRKEILREELHEILTSAFHVKTIHSEYGMTEMLSQAYSDGNGIYKCSSTLKVLVRDPYDPTIVKNIGKGVLNIIDLANVHSCSFIATDDLGEVFEDGSFKVLGRLDSSQMRGCNLMFE
jgi:hypothetical protein